MGFFSSTPKNCPNCGFKLAKNASDDGASPQQCSECGKKCCYVCASKHSPGGGFKCPDCGHFSFKRY